MAKKHGGTPTVKALIEAGVDFTLYPHEHGDGETSFGAEVVRKLEVEAEADRVFKTLDADLGGELVVGIVPVPRQLDLKALPAALGAKKATLAASPDEAACSTGTSSAASPRSVADPAADRARRIRGRLRHDLRLGRHARPPGRGLPPPRRPARVDRCDIGPHCDALVAALGETGTSAIADQQSVQRPRPASRARMMAWVRSATCSLAKIAEM